MDCDKSPSSTEEDKPEAVANQCTPQNARSESTGIALEMFGYIAEGGRGNG
jgi:hypothetical protein